MTSKKSYKHDKERNDIILNCIDKYNVIPDIVQIIIDMLTINLFEIGVCEVINNEEHLRIYCKTNIIFTSFNYDIWNEYKLFESYLRKCECDYWILPWVMKNSINFTIMHEKEDSNVNNNVDCKIYDYINDKKNNPNSDYIAWPLNLMKLYYNEHRSQ